MSNYKKGDWCNEVDGLYWGLSTTTELFAKNPRMSLSIRQYDRIKPERQKLISQACKNFIKEIQFNLGYENEKNNRMYWRL